MVLDVFQKELVMEKVACPTCGAPKGFWCAKMKDVSRGRGFRKAAFNWLVGTTQPHAARIKAASALEGGA